MKRFTDFAQEHVTLEGEKIKLDDVLNKEIVVLGFDTKPSRFPKEKNSQYLTLQFKYPNKNEFFVIFTGSGVITDQLERYKDELPFLTTIKKVNRYYTLS